MDPETQPENEFNRRQRQLMINLDRKAFYATGQDHMKIEDTSKSTRREKIQRKKSKLSRSKKKTKKEKLEDRSFSSLLPMRQQTRPRHGDAMRLSDGTGDIFAKEWVFSTNASPPPVRAWVDYKRGVNAEGNGVNLFFQDYEDSEALCDLDEVRDFSEGVSLEELRSGAGAAGSHRAAWLDSRVLSNQAAGNMVKEYPNPLTPTALYKYLSRNLISDQRANRVLIYIANLDPNFLLALAETAPYNHADALRDAVRKHLAFQSSIRVFSNTRSYPTFQLSLHISYFAVRKCPPPSESGRPASGQDSTNQWMDLSFLKMTLANASQTMSSFSLYKSRFSLVVCGSNDSLWTGYSFVDRDLEENPFEEGDFCYQDNQPHEDPISSDSGSGSIDANVPLWDPRAYWLVVLEVRIIKVHKEWESIVRILERNFVSYNVQKLAAMSRQRGNANRTQKGKEAFDWIQDVMQLIVQLLNVLSQTVKSWEYFRSSRGGISYFESFGCPELQKRTHMALRNINLVFEDLQSCRDRLDSLNKTCQSSADALDLRLTLESNEVVQHTSLTTEWTISIFTPIALCIAYFSMPDSVMPFTPSRTRFVIAMVIILICVRLLFEISRGALDQTWWWRGLTWPLRFIHLDESAPSTRKRSGCLPDSFTRNRHYAPDPDLEENGPDSTNRM